MNNRRVFSYDFVRCLCMLGIVWFHFYQVFQGPAEVYITGPNSTLGRQAVTVFFILSGVMSGRSAKQKDSQEPLFRKAWDYYKKRWWAIFPAFYLAYLMAMVILQAGPGLLLTPRILFTLLGIDGYLAEGGVATSYLIGEWFLGCLILLYIATTFLLQAIKKHPLWAGICALLIYGTVLLLPSYIRMTETSVLIRGFDYIVGIYLGLYLQNMKWQLALPSLILWPVLWLIPLPLPGSLTDSLLGLSSYFVMLYIGELLDGTNPLLRLIQLPVRFLAARSYEVFLLHHVILYRYAQDLSEASFIKGTGWFLFVFAMIVALSTILHACVHDLKG
ncbi:MAG: acyltransferase [Lachnospiraceae bacterium]|nr:acyltransferase [Lachnospiraceae bacterium]